MQHQKTNISKKHFRIGDLAKELDVKKFVIRFWEKEFGLDSERSSGGQRAYTQDDLKTFITIKDLLYNHGFTIAGAKKQLRELRKNPHARIEKEELTPEAVVAEETESLVAALSVAQDEGSGKQKAVAEGEMLAVHASVQVVLQEERTHEDVLYRGAVINEVTTPQSTPMLPNNADVQALKDKLTAFKEQLITLRNLLDK